MRRLFRKFEVSSTAKILDFSCGIGRHSILLGKAGYKVVAQYYLDIAKQSASRYLFPNDQPKFIRGSPYNVDKVLSKHQEYKFDVIILMDNSFGYLGDKMDTIMLRQLSRVGNDNCILILETENRDWRLQNFEPITHYEFDNIELYATWQFDFQTSVSHGISKFYEKTGMGKNLKLALELNTPMRLYSLHEIDKLMEISGWKCIDYYDDICDLATFKNRKTSIFTIGRKSPN